MAELFTDHPFNVHLRGYHYIIHIEINITVQPQQKKSSDFNKIKLHMPMIYTFSFF